ncbi:hypothetical protein DPMN_053144 [Dreissena polymorpha]|uniref:Mab-21-like HhH/H2TH-like domain-containing protein n=1 Tax=Dreissena polymorpha TaxID=45954 RepID=A0A9D4CKU3_DREPO|nr:hypothetical protein DPMN_053144 [Dreissena polymorpha]
MKMIRKELFKKVVGDRLSTFHFKTALLWTVETYPPEIWRENNLENCIMYCLVTLRRWMGRRYCPHYTRRDINLFSGKLKYAEFPKWIVLLSELIDTRLEFLNELVMDNLGLRLKEQMKHSGTSKLPTRSENHTWIVKYLLENYMYKLFLIPLSVCNILRFKLASHEIMDRYTAVWEEVRRHLAYSLSTETDIVIHMGNLFAASVLASLYLEKGLPILSQITAKYEKSLKVDLLSARLTYASLLLNIGQVDRAAKLLFDIEASLPSEVYEFIMQLPAFLTPGPELV